MLDEGNNYYRRSHDGPKSFRGQRVNAHRPKSINIAGRRVTVEVETRNVRHAYIRVGVDYRLKITLPRGSRISPQAILEKKRPWIEKKIQEISERKSVLTDEHVLIHGQAFAITEIPASKAGVRLYKQVVHIYMTQDGGARRILSAYLAEMTHGFVSDVAPRLAKALGVRYRSLHVKQMKRWGQCSRDGELKFSDKLICLPREVAECVVLHELVHLKHFDHSPRFRREMERQCPDHRELEKQLKMYIT
jgi:predicted metal-dependent hydrolase